MWFARTIAVVCLVGAVIGGAACAEPPDSEIQQAQGAIDAARSAGAEMYATEELTAALEALARSREAVGLRDYRLALSHALDSRERAQNAAKQTADGMAAARVEADRALTSLTEALAAARASLLAAESARTPRRTLTSPRRTIADADDAVQEARAALEGGDYRATIGIASKTLPSLRELSDQLKSATAAVAKRPR